MFAKLGFLIVIAILGALVFVVGTLTPDSLRETVSTKAREIAASVKIKLPESGTKKDSTAPSAPTATPTSSAATNAAGEKPKDDKAATDAVPYDTLLLSVAPAPEVRFALEAGMFPDAATANAFAKKIVDLKQPVKTINVIDKDKSPWTVVAVGTYSSPGDARAARARMAEQMGVARTMNVIQLPPEKK